MSCSTKAIRYKPYWKNNGGITVSGGEPLVQLDFVTEFFRLMKKEGVHTCVDTAGQPFRRDPEWLDRFNELMSLTDLFMLDLKQFDSKLHVDLTGKVTRTSSTWRAICPTTARKCGFATSSCRV